MGDEYETCGFCHDHSVLVNATNVDLIPPRLFDKPICTECTETVREFIKDVDAEEIRQG
jgi:hypothetical protein